MVRLNEFKIWHLDLQRSFHLLQIRLEQAVYPRMENALLVERLQTYIGTVLDMLLFWQIGRMQMTLKK